jgi:hypothetical protein
MNVQVSRGNPFPCLGQQGCRAEGKTVSSSALPFFEVVVDSNLLSTSATGLRPAQRAKLKNLTQSALQRLSGSKPSEAFPFLQQSAKILDRQLKRLIQQGLVLNTLRAAVYQNIGVYCFPNNLAKSNEAIGEGLKAATLNYALQEKGPKN